jgi:hypothetical protein
MEHKWNTNKISAIYVGANGSLFVRGGAVGQYLTRECVFPTSSVVVTHSHSKVYVVTTAAADAAVFISFWV